jgi:cyclohexanecarboxylate-CoA ligase
VCVGYLSPADNADAFTDDGYFRTGDRAAIEATTHAVEIVGRIKDVIIRGGENISAAEVEAVLEAHPAVRHAVAVGYPDEQMGERVAVFVEVEQPFDVDAARAWFSARGVARYKTPERVIVVDVMPLLASGKPDRTALRRSVVPG